MPSLVQKLAQRELINGVPSWLPESIQYEVTMGSEAYGVSSNNSDIDIYGFCIPEKTMVFPHLAGEIEGFGTKYERFGTWEQHHVLDPQARNNKGAEYDFQIHAMPKYFNLLMGCNPNIIDSLFVPARCIRYMTPIGEKLRESRRIFLSKKAWHTYKGYSFKQIHKMRTKEHAEIAQRVRELESLLGLEHATTLEQAEKLAAGKTAEEVEYLSLFRKGIEKTKRFQMVKEHGFDVKFAYNVVRLLNEVEMIMTEGDLDIERNREQLKSIRRGEWTYEQICDYFNKKEKELETLYQSSTLRHSPDEQQIRNLLLDCLEMRFGNLSGVVERPDKADATIKQIVNILKTQRYI